MQLAVRVRAIPGTVEVGVTRKQQHRRAGRQLASGAAVTMPEKAVVICGGVTCCVLLITSIILLVCSFSTLEPNEVGIEYNANTLSINTDELYESGRHFLGLGHSFLIYPKTLQQVRFAETEPTGTINVRRLPRSPCRHKSCLTRTVPRSRYGSRHTGEDQGRPARVGVHVLQL